MRGKAVVDLQVGAATEADVAAIAAMRNLVSEHLCAQYGEGHWSSTVSEKGVAHGLRTSRVLIGRSDGVIVATLRLATKKPWAIDRSYFTVVRRPLYLVDMAVHPDFQRRGIGRQMLNEAASAARGFPADAIFLDSYDADAGAGRFYLRCGYREVGRVVYRRTPLIYFELLLP